MEGGPAKAGNVLVRIAQAELLDNVVANALRGAGGERRDGVVGKEFAELAELAVFRAEFVAPFGDAMRFIDGKKGQRQAFQPLRSVAQSDAFRGKIHEAVLPGDRALERTATV